MTASQTLLGLAVLRVNFDRGDRDFIDSFVPFAAHCLKAAPNRHVSLPDLQACIHDEFGLSIPQAALRTVLNRAVRAGLAERSQGVFVRNDEALDAINLGPARLAARQQFDALLASLTEHARQLGQEWSVVESEQALLGFVADRAASLLATRVLASPLLLPNVAPEHSDYVVHSYVVRLYETRSEHLLALETAIKGTVLSSALYFPDLASVGESLRRVVVYWDTRLLLHALGTAGATQQAASMELLGLTQELGATSACFDTTLGEIRGILSTASHALRDRSFRRMAHGESIDHIVMHLQRSDVEELIADLPDRLLGLGVAVQRRPAHHKRLTVGERAFEEALLGAVKYQREEPMRHDLDAVTAIWRLRDGAAVHRLEEARALFVTTNHALARATRDFFNSEYGDQPVPLCIPEHQFGTLLWLKRPQSRPELPMQLALADSYAALNPPDELWRLYLKEIDSLQQQGDISEDSYHVLRYSTAARAALMEYTLGDSDGFVEGTVPEILERAMENVRRDLQEQVALSGDQAFAAEARAAEAEQRVKDRELQDSRRVSRLSASAARWVVRAPLFVLVIVLLSAAVLTTIAQITGETVELDSPPVILGLILLNAVGVAGLIFGTSVLGLSRRAEAWLAGKLEPRIRSLLYAAGDEGPTTDAS